MPSELAALDIAALDVLDAIRDEAIAIQDEDRYGHFSNPVMLGLLLAAEIVRRVGGHDE